MKEKKYNYIYKTTNLINGKYYLGVRCTNKLKDGYIGCGITSQNIADNRSNRGVKGFCKAVSKYGYVNFKKEILYFFKTAEEAYYYEKKIVNQMKVDSKKCYNLTKGGKSRKNNSRFYKFKSIWEFFYKQGYSMGKIGKWYGTTHGTVRLVIDKDLIKNSDKTRGLKKHAMSKGRKVRCVETGKVFRNQKEACLEMFGKRQSNISLVLSGKLERCKGYSFEYVEE